MGNFFVCEGEEDYLAKFDAWFQTTLWFQVLPCLTLLFHNLAHLFTTAGECEKTEQQPLNVGLEVKSQV